MTTEQVRQALSEQSVLSDVVGRKNITIEATEHNAEKVTALIHKSEQYGEKRRDDDLPIACVTAATIDSNGVSLMWTYGYARQHDELFIEAGQEPGEDGILLHLGDDVVRMRTNYIAADDIDEKVQAVLWRFYADPAILQKHAAVLKSMIASANKALDDYMVGEWGASAGSLDSEIWLKNSVTNQEGWLTLD